MVNYGDLPKKYTKEKDARVVILPVPYDGTSTWVKGADKGPEALLEASANMELYDIETDTEVYRIGIHTAKPVTESDSPESMVRAVRKRSEEYLGKGKFLVTLGGEHSISIGAIQAHAARFQNLTILQIDAHTDLRESYEGSRTTMPALWPGPGSFAPSYRWAFVAWTWARRQIWMPAAFSGPTK
jgi:agmatinase